MHHDPARIQTASTPRSGSTTPNNIVPTETMPPHKSDHSAKHHAILQSPAPNSSPPTRASPPPILLPIPPSAYPKIDSDAAKQMARNLSDSPPRCSQSPARPRVSLHLKSPQNFFKNFHKHDSASGHPSPVPLARTSSAIPIPSLFFPSPFYLATHRAPAPPVSPSTPDSLAQASAAALSPQTPCSPRMAPQIHYSPCKQSTNPRPFARTPGRSARARAN